MKPRTLLGAAMALLLALFPGCDGDGGESSIVPKQESTTIARGAESGALPAAGLVTVHVDRSCPDQAIYVDGQAVCTAECGKPRLFEMEPGAHEIQACDATTGCVGDAVIMDAGDRYTLHVTCVNVGAWAGVVDETCLKHLLLEGGSS